MQSAANALNANSRRPDLHIVVVYDLIVRGVGQDAVLVEDLNTRRCTTALLIARRLAVNREVRRTVKRNIIKTQATASALENELNLLANLIFRHFKHNRLARIYTGGIVEFAEIRFAQIGLDSRRCPIGRRQ